MKNILVCSIDYAIGANGAFHFARFIRDINKTSDKYTVFLLTEDFEGGDLDWQTDAPETFVKVPLKIPPRLFMFTHLVRNWVYFRAIRRFQKQNRVDAVIFNQTSIGVLSRWCLSRKVKIISIVHDCNSLDPQRSAFPTYKAYLYRISIQLVLERLAMRSYDFIWANSVYILNLIKEKKAVAPNKLGLLYQSIDVKNIDFKPKNRENTEGSILDESQLETHKILFIKVGFIGGGLTDLLAALGQLAPLCFDLSVVGNLPSTELIINDLARPYENILVKTWGIQSSKVVSELFYQHDILCIPSRHEALGLANVEGLAHGISVVSSTVGGIPEVLDNGNCGWLAAPQNPVALAAALKNCIESTPSVRLAKSQFGRAHVARFFSKEKMLTEVLALLDKLTEQ